MRYSQYSQYGQWTAFAHGGGRVRSRKLLTDLGLDCNPNYIDQTNEQRERHFNQVFSTNLDNCQDAVMTNYQVCHDDDDDDDDHDHDHDDHHDADDALLVAHFP